MKTNKLIVSGCVILSILFTASCNKQGPDNPSGEVSEKLEAALLSRYPDAQNVKWTQKSGYYVADFSSAIVRSSSDAVQNSAWFDDDCNWHMTEVDIPYNALPEAVRNAFESSEYADWRVDDVDMITRDGVETIYVIEAEGRTADGVEQDVDLYYSEDGILVKVVVDAEDDYDYEDYIPDNTNSSIEEFISQRYPDARIVEIDDEDGMTEVEIIDGRVCRELLFDRQGNWIYTKTEVRVNDVPEEIIGYLESSEYGSYRVEDDDVDFYETPESEYYRFELEYRDDDVKVDVYTDGRVELVNRDNDDDDGNGSMVAGDIESFIESKYPGATILEYDYDDGYLNVEIYHDNREKEVYFNGSNEWVFSKWDVRISELPEALKTAITERYGKCEIDDAEYRQTPDGDYYIVEVEVENGGNDDDFELRIDANGNFL